MKDYLIILLALLMGTTGFCQKKVPLSISFFDNQTKLAPEIFNAKFHPGVSLGIEHVYSRRRHHVWLQTAKLGYFYHQFSEHALQLYTEGGYRYLLRGMDITALLGGGYLHAFPDIQQFKLKDGKYKRKSNTGRPQLMATASICLGYDATKKFNLPMRFFLEYQFWLQMPFVNKYVPILPNTAIHLGVVYQLSLNKP